jgi:hypothetical protein
MTLLDYANNRENVVAFVAGIGDPMGSEYPVGHPDMDFVDRRGLLQLDGHVGPNGDWAWDGAGNPTDDRSNTITQVMARVAPETWDRIVAEWEEA